MVGFYKTVGILGGMGPFATAAFFEKMLRFTPAEKDWEHLHIIIDNNPHIPSRSRYLLYGEESPVKGMIASCKRLEKYPVDFVVIPCNSASYFIPEIQPAINVPIVNIMQVTAAALKQRYSNVKRVAVIGGVITYEKKSYQTFLNQHGIQYIHHTLDIQKQIEQLIEKIKLGEISETVTDDFNSIVGKIQKKYSVDAIILGCTEFGCMLNVSTNCLLVDSNTELAKYTIGLARGINNG